MKNCLIFPPKWSVAHPYLSTPCLKAYLNEHGIEIDQYDFNLEELEYFTSKPFLDICMNKILKKGISIESEEIYRLLYDYLIKNIDNFKNNVGSLDYFIELENYKKWKNLFQSYNSFVSTSFELFRTSLDYVNFGEEITINNIESIVKDRDINPYIDFAEYIIDKTDLLDFGFIGFSVVVPEQIVPVLTLCNYIKTLNSDIHICIGGSIGVCQVSCRI